MVCSKFVSDIGTEMPLCNTANLSISPLVLFIAKRSKCKPTVSCGYFKKHVKRNDYLIRGAQRKRNKSIF